VVERAVVVERGITPSPTPIRAMSMNEVSARVSERAKASAISG